VQNDLAKNAFNAGCRHFCIDAGGQTQIENINSIMVFGAEEMDGKIFISTKINAGRGIEEEIFEKILENKLDLIFIEIGHEKQRMRRKAEEKVNKNKEYNFINFEAAGNWGKCGDY
jgi:hypothetical protein